MTRAGIGGSQSRSCAGGIGPFNDDAGVVVAFHGEVRHFAGGPLAVALTPEESPGGAVVDALALGHRYGCRGLRLGRWSGGSRSLRVGRYGQRDQDGEKERCNARLLLRPGATFGLATSRTANGIRLCMDRIIPCIT